MMLTSHASFGNDDLNNVSIVLVGTLRGGNVGSAARAMKNMGLRRLKLISPQCVLGRECRMMAAGALEIVEGAQIFDTLDEGLRDEQLVWGTTSQRDRRLEGPPVTPRRAAAHIRRAARQNRVAVLFGPERAGLDDATLSRCRNLISVPAHAAHPVLNVAQSVMLVAYEIFAAKAPPPSAARGEPLCTDEERQGMFHHLESCLNDIGFFASQNQPHMMKALRRLFGKSDLTRRDVRIVRGILSQVEWAVEQGPQTRGTNDQGTGGEAVGRAAGGAQRSDERESF